MVGAKKINNLISLGFILTLAFFLRIPSLFEPNHYGDEGIYQVLGQAVRRGQLLYRDIWDNKPPLLYFLYSFVDGNQFLIRLLSLLFTLFTIVVFYLLACAIFPKRTKIVFFTTFLFALLFSLPLLEGNIANSENFMFLPILLAFYLTFKNFPRFKTSLLFLVGFLFSLAFLLKIVAIFDLAALSFFLLISLWGQRQKQVKFLVILASGFALPLLLTALFFSSQGIFNNFLSATFSQNVSYVAWGNKLLIAQGWLLVKLLLLALFSLFLFKKRRGLDKGQLLILLWWAFSLFNAFFAERPWIHYLLVLVPASCLLLGSAWETTKWRILTVVFLFLTLSLAGTKFWVYKETLAYYPNFFSFIVGQKTLQEYRSFWGDHVDRDYRAAQILALKTRPGEPIFVWGNSAQVYALAKRPPASRYVVAYHMSFTPQAEQETLQDLIKNEPRYFVILLPQVYPLGNLEGFLARNYQLFFREKDFLIYERLP